VKAHACRKLKHPDDKIAMHAAAAVWHACKKVLAKSHIKTAKDVLKAADVACRNYVHLTLWAFNYPLASPRAPPISLLVDRCDFEVGAKAHTYTQNTECDAGRWARPVVVVVVVVTLEFELLGSSRSGAFRCWRGCSVVGVALEVISFVPGLRLAFVLLPCCVDALVMAVVLVLCFLHGAPCCLLRSARCVAAPLAVCNTNTHRTPQLYACHMHGFLNTMYPHS
jgi:hypothetical protein